MGYFNAIYAAELPHRDVAVYMYLKHRANTEGRCWPSVRTIAKDLSLSRATVQRALRELQQGGWILAEPRWRENGSCTSNSYRLL
jgi:DNA-binding transcriptional MocR family regulator